MLDVFSRGRPTLALVALVAVAHGCDNPGRPASLDPEGVPSALTFGVTVTERIAYLGDADTYTFELKAGEEAIAFLQETERLGARIHAGIRVVGSAPIGYQGIAMEAAGPDEDFELTTGGRISFGTDAKFTLVVRGDLGPTGNETAGGGYRLQVRRIDPRPERGPVALSIGDTIQEAIDHVGDRDVFTLSGGPGTEYVLFAGAQGEPPREVVVTLDIPGGRIFSAKPGIPLLRNQSGRFTMPATGTVTVHVTDYYDKRDLYRGPYTLFAHRVNRGPESHPATITLATGAIVEAIGIPGDIDEFLLTTTEPATVNLFLTRFAENAVGGGVWVALLPIDGVNPLKTAGTLPEYLNPLPVAVGTTERFVLPAGSYRLRVQGSKSDTTAFQGTYELDLYHVNVAPESLPAVFAIGDTIRGESLERPGDIDTFRFSGTPADTLSIGLTPVAGGALANHYFVVRRRDTGAVIAEPGLRALPDGRTYRETVQFQLPAVGEYEVEVSTGGRIGEHGPYELFSVIHGGRPAEARPQLVRIDVR